MTDARELLKPSPFLNFIDLVGRGHVTLTIEKFIPKKSWPQPVRGEKAALSFAKTPKVLLLNDTNIKSLILVLGADTSAWPGKRIKVWGDPNVELFKKKVGGVVILREDAPPQAAAPQLNQVTPDQEKVREENLSEVQKAYDKAAQTNAAEIDYGNEAHGL